MHQTCGGDDLVRRIASEIQRPDLAAHGKIYGPHVDVGKRARQIRGVHVKLDSPQLRELG